VRALVDDRGCPWALSVKGCDAERPVLCSYNALVPSLMTMVRRSFIVYSYFTSVVQMKRYGNVVSLHDEAARTYNCCRHRTRSQTFMSLPLGIRSPEVECEFEVHCYVTMHTTPASPTTMHVGG